MQTENKNYLSGKELLDEQVHIGEKKGSRQYLIQSVLNGCIAGAFLALGAFAALVASHGISDYGLAKLVNAVIFPSGLILIVICGGELFTSNTLLIQARLERKITTKTYLLNLVIIYITNAVGAISIAALIFGAGIVYNDSNSIGAYVIHVAAIKANYTFGQNICSGIMCNILVCCAAWGASAAKDVAGKILIIWFAIMVFIIGGYEHCVANMFYFSLALFAKTVPSLLAVSHLNPEVLNNLNFTGVMHNLLPVTIGNIIGGALFIGTTYWIVYFRGYKE
ncbi:MAG: formate/nitrite transporter family protein [Neisseriaceae bacterium]|nr:MAG: formate/nitrite transporter family protein [Neisseriaceae bacterium]